MTSKQWATHTSQCFSSGGNQQPLHHPLSFWFYFLSSLPPAQHPLMVPSFFVVVVVVVVSTSQPASQPLAAAFGCCHPAGATMPAKPATTTHTFSHVFDFRSLCIFAAASRLHLLSLWHDCFVLMYSLLLCYLVVLYEYQPYEQVWLLPGIPGTVGSYLL